MQVKSHPLKYDFHNNLDSNTQTMTDVVASRALMRKNMVRLIRWWRRWLQFIIDGISRDKCQGNY